MRDEAEERFLKKYRGREEPRRKDKDLYEVVEEVFDTYTLMALYELMRRKIIARMHGVVSSGKEARVYWAEDPGGRDLAVKIYLTVTAEFRKSMRKYIEGDPRFQGLLLRDSRSLMAAWARKEYRNLARLREAGVSVPRPIAVNKTIVVMEFIGERGVRAPLLKEAPPPPGKAPGILSEILGNLRRAYCGAKLVHADLSEYNVMMWRGRIVIIDVSQAVHISHPLAEEFLHRDLGNILRFFSREVGISAPSIDEAYRVVADCRGLQGSTLKSR